MVNTKASNCKGQNMESPSTTETNNPSFKVALALALSNYTLAGRGRLRREIGKYVLNHLSSPIEVDLWGARVKLYPHSNQCDFKILMKPNHYCKKEMSFLDEALDSEGAVYFDIGANSGFFSLNAAVNARKKRRVFSFEPNPEMVRRIKEKFENQKNQAVLASTEWTLCPYALGDEDGTSYLTIPNGNYGEAHLSELKEGIEVQLKSLQSVVEEHSIEKIDALKIDVEGYEDRIMKQLFEIMDKGLWPKAIIIEYVNKSSWEWDPVQEALSNGYIEAFKTRNNIALIYQD